MKYAPPELWYEKTPTKWENHYLGCDFYMLGSLVYFLTTGSSMTPELLGRIDDEYHPRYWYGTYDEVLPYVKDVFLQIVQELRDGAHAAIASDITEVVKQLCNPCPKKRGLPMNKGTYRYSLEKLVSKLDLIYKRNKFFFLRATSPIPEAQI